MHLLQQHLQRTAQDQGRPGIYSVCSAHPWVLRAAAEQARDDGRLLLIEATSNQVNQLGGYTGMQPAGFRGLVEKIVDAAGLDRAKLILGGDHLGPNPWRDQEPESAMARAEEMVAAYAAAGFSKIHLDASMPCRGEGFAVDDAVVAKRAARLCVAAERAAASVSLPGPVYVIGTEVPTPGGAVHDLDSVAVTTVSAAQQTLEVHREAFAKSGLSEVWPRVLALVVQPGVEFDHDRVIHYEKTKAASLSGFIQRRPEGLVYEAHSTDYQRPSAYVEMVEDGFAILKVGPALTFAMREALFALAAIELELTGSAAASHLPEVVERTMLKDPTSWRAYYTGCAAQQHRLRVYSYSDRIRYYWNQPHIEAAVAHLISNLGRTGLPETMLSAFLPRQYVRVRAGTISPSVGEIIVDRIRDVLRVYAAAC